MTITHSGSNSSKTGLGRSLLREDGGGMVYPQKLVHKYGAKAGMLMYVREKLPDIPQVDMIVKTPEEPIDDALKRADKTRILWPRIFRSSAIAELQGYEGEFPTRIVEGFEEVKARIINPRYCGPYSSKEEFNRWVMGLVERIQKSPGYLKKENPKEHEHLPEDICVIIAEQSPSSILGTLIKHPNQKGFYIIAAGIVPATEEAGWFHSAYTYTEKEGIQSFKGFDKGNVEFSLGDINSTKMQIRLELEQVVSWHDRIAALPDMDPRWTYQLEFGLDPVCLYQVRPFKEIVSTDFTIEPPQQAGLHFVIGVTSKDGVNLRVEKDIKERLGRQEEINPENQPSVFWDTIRNARYCNRLPNHQANILTQGIGILAHRDIYAIRRGMVSGVFATDYYSYPEIDCGDWVNLISDGTTINITRV
jgi:hypothetical protein